MTKALKLAAVLLAVALPVQAHDPANCQGEFADVEMWDREVQGYIGQIDAYFRRYPGTGELPAAEFDPFYDDAKSLRDAVVEFTDSVNELKDCINQ